MEKPCFSKGCEGAYYRVLKLARTIADLAGAAAVGQAHVAEAIQYRRALRER